MIVHSVSAPAAESTPLRIRSLLLVQPVVPAATLIVVVVVARAGVATRRLRTAVVVVGV